MTAPRWIPLLLGLFLSCALPAHAGLYGDEGKDVKSGDLNDQDYWWTKYDMTMLDLCLKQHQPEGKIGLELASTIRRLDDLVKKYPQHAGLKEWKQHADEVAAKIDPNASRGGSFNPGCPWDQSNFGQAWVNWRHAKMLMAAKSEDQAFGLYQNVKQNFAILLKPGRMDDYPADLRQWVIDSSKELDTFYDKLREKTHH